jgi:hypothetical protein
MVPVNLINEISALGFDYNLSPREVAKRVAFGHRVSSSTKDEDRRGGALTIWDKTLKLPEAPYAANFTPSEADIMEAPEEPFPYLKLKASGGIGGGIGGGIESFVPPDKMPADPGGEPKPNPLLPKPKPKPTGDPNEDDKFE